MWMRRKTQPPNGDLAGDAVLAPTRHHRATQFFKKLPEVPQLLHCGRDVLRRKRTLRGVPELVRPVAHHAHRELRTLRERRLAVVSKRVTQLVDRLVWHSVVADSTQYFAL